MNLNANMNRMSSSHDIDNHHNRHNHHNNNNTNRNRNKNLISLNLTNNDREESIPDLAHDRDDTHTSFRSNTAVSIGTSTGSSLSMELGNGVRKHKDAIEPSLSIEQYPKNYVKLQIQLYSTNVEAKDCPSQLNLNFGDNTHGHHQNYSNINSNVGLHSK